jgi:hypothetical protein
MFKLRRRRAPLAKKIDNNIIYLYNIINNDH